MQKMTIPFIHSLHRPFNQQLKASRWVCMFVNSSKQNIKSSNLNQEFYFYILNKLQKEYSSSLDEVEFNGIPSKHSINEVYDYFQGKSKKKKVKTLIEVVRKEREFGVEKQVYSTYKAASYYVNMAKDKLKLIDNNNKLTQHGKELLSFKSSFFKLSSKEKDFFYKRILDVDFLVLISLIFFKQLGKKYKIKEYSILHYDFLDKFYKISHFNFTSPSLNNYNVVRNFWIESLDLIDKRMKLKNKFIDSIHKNELFTKWYEDLSSSFNEFEKNDFRKKKNYISNKLKLEQYYKKCVEEDRSDLGFVNLYEIKKAMKMSFPNFEDFLNYYYEQEKSKKYIFFSNIVSSIDRRKRFEVRGVPILKIRIKE